MKLTALPLPGCYLLEAPMVRDPRGSFFKPFVRSLFGEYGLNADFVEQYCSTSAKNVVRGMHLQLPPHDHAKLVYCAAGAITDVLLDLRAGGDTYGQFIVLDLTAASGRAVYIPAGIAHGFLAVEEPALLVYNVTSEYAPSHEGGIRWDSFGYPWPIVRPLLSARDTTLPTLQEFVNPFLFTSPTQADIS